jgi:DNA polymerase kappa
MTFMSTLPVRKVNGIGRVFERELAAVGIKTCGDIYAARGLLRPLFGVKARDFLLTTYLGLGRTAICRADEYERKSIGTERTFADLGGAEKLREKLRRTAEELERELGNTPDVVGGKTLVLKVKLHTYEVLTRQRNLGRPVATAEELYTNALPLLVALESEYPGLKIRLLGLRVTHLVPRREKVDVLKWFFGNKRPGQKRKAPELDEDGWEVWPEEEFEHAQLKETEEELQLTQELQEELQEELEAREKEGKGKGKEEPPVETWECPICGSHQPADDTRFNQHMDFCLSKEAIRSAVRESSRMSEGPPPPQKKKKQLVFPGPSKR